VFENRVLRIILGLKRDKDTGGWRKLHDEEFHNLYTSSHITSLVKPRRIRWAGNVACVGEMRNINKVLVRNPEGRSRRRWKYIV
jgi:hypothetical protein